MDKGGDCIQFNTSARRPGTDLLQLLLGVVQRCGRDGAVVPGRERAFLVEVAFALATLKAFIVNRKYTTFVISINDFCSIIDELEVYIIVY